MSVVKVDGPPVDKNILIGAMNTFIQIIRGMWMTNKIMFLQMFKIEKSDTLEWPEQPATYGPRFKGRHFLTKRPDGEVRCTACFLCATACPAECIHIEAGQHDNNSVEKYPVRFEIDILRCVFCGFCEEACPLDAIRLGPEFVMTGTTERKWVYTKEFLADRKELAGGIQTMRPANVKHPSISHEPTADERKAVVKHGSH